MKKEHPLNENKVIKKQCDKLYNALIDVITWHEFKTKRKSEKVRKLYRSYVLPQLVQRLCALVYTQTYKNCDDGIELFVDEIKKDIEDLFDEESFFDENNVQEIIPDVGALA